MAGQVSFKTRVKDTAISIAPDYYSYYVCRDFPNSDIQINHPHVRFHNR